MTPKVTIDLTEYNSLISEISKSKGELDNLKGFSPTLFISDGYLTKMESMWTSLRASSNVFIGNRFRLPFQIKYGESHGGFTYLKAEGIPNKIAVFVRPKLDEPGRLLALTPDEWDRYEPSETEQIPNT